VEQAAEKKTPITFSDFLRKRTKGLLDPIGAFFNHLGLMPNTMTLIGLAGNAVGAFFLARGNMTIGGLIILAMGPVDALDGTMARLRGEPEKFGAFVDSVTDRYSELFIFAGLLIHTLRQENWLMALMIYVAAAGSVMVSYVRARGQSVEMDTKVGWFSRLERYLILALSLIFNQAEIGIWIIAIFANITALQRIAHVRRQARPLK
jgi:CDP-diacylglycerol--glycerol-3-phosphate 3-phosphatidyltransferase